MTAPAEPAPPAVPPGAIPLPSREEEALAEIAATRLGRTGSLVLTLGLLAAIAVGGLLEASRARRGEATAFTGGAPIPTPRELLESFRASGALAANRRLRDGLAGLEDRLGRESALSAALRPAAQTVLARHLGYGNSQVLVGREGWLHFRIAFDYLTGHPFLAEPELARRRAHGTRYAVPQPDPVPGLLQLRDELAQRGIELVFFPVPVKAQIHPESLVRLGALGPAGLANDSFPELVRRLAAGGLPVYDALPELRAAALEGESLYLATDTHWSPAGMRVAAAGLARFLAEATSLPALPPAGFRRRSFAHELEGDLARLLGAGLGGPIFPPERIDLDEIVGLGDLPYTVDPAPAGAPTTPPPPASPPTTGGDLLLLGDSYSLVYSNAGGRSASFAEQLAFALDRPVRRAAKVASNNLAGRAHWLREDPGLLTGVSVVVYEVTARSLASADWTASSIEPQP